MLRIKFANFFLFCPHSVSYPRRIQLRYYEQDDGQNLYQIFEGCDFFHPCDTCIDCTRKLNMYLLTHNHIHKETLHL